MTLIYQLTGSLKRKINRTILRFRMNTFFLNAAIRQANRMHKKTGLRYRVFFFGHKYYAWIRSDIQEQKRLDLLKKDRKVGADFDSISFYDTNSLKNG
jgi:hypothetical protein